MNGIKKDFFHTIGNEKIKEIAYFSVVFEGVKDYLHENFNSLLAQTCIDFDIFLINDGIKNIEAYLPKIGNINFFILNLTETPAALREIGINLISERGYRYIVFGDSDDYFEKNRVQKSIELLSDFDIVVNDFNIVSEDKPTKEQYLSKRFLNRQEIFFDDIRDKNFIGLTNSAIRTDKLKSIFLHRELIAVDWFIFSCFLLQGMKTVFTNETLTYYRRHSSNVVGVDEITSDKIEKGILVKTMHYCELAKVSLNFVNYCESFGHLKETIDKDSDANKKYIDYAKREYMKIATPLWWEEIKIMEGLCEHSDF